MNIINFKIRSVIVSLSAGLFAVSASANLQLNSQGLALGLRLSTFVSDMPISMVSNCNCGPVGMTSTAAGDILVADFAGDIYRFADRDNQTPANALSVISSGPATGTTPALALSGGTVYLGRDNKVYSLNNDGSIKSLFFKGEHVVSGGLAANPVTGHLYSNSNLDPTRNLSDMNPVTGTFSFHPAGGGGIGSVSLDGKTLYLNHYPVLQAFDTVNYHVVWTSTRFSGGSAVIPIGSHTGDILGYDQTLGDLLIFAQNTGVATVIGSGGLMTNGETFGIDHLNNTLFLSIGSQVLRVAVVPELPPHWMLVVGLASLGFARVRRNQPAAV
jgi:hypothetical protein